MITKIIYLPYITYLLLIILIYRYEVKKYKTNTPYTPSKKKRKTLQRIYLGILAGIHYSHFIGTYNHKKYNTQVFTPKTLECNIGGTLSAIFLAIYPIIAWSSYKIIGAISLLIMLIPIILNLISIYLDKKSH
jgi:hypothetical protein